MSTEAVRITQLLRLAVKYYKAFYICNHNATSLRSRKFLELSPKSKTFSDSQTYSSLPGHVTEETMPTFGTEQTTEGNEHKQSTLHGTTVDYTVCRLLTFFL